MLTVRSSWRIHLLVLLVYTLLALALTWPVVSHSGTHVPGNGVDDPPLTWNLWWVRYALLEQGTNPFDCDYMFYPQGINLAFYTLTMLNGLLSIPLQATVGLIPASNVLLISSFVLGGYGAFLLAGYLSPGTQGVGQPVQSNRYMKFELRVPYLAAFLAGGLYAFAASKLSYAALGQWNIASSQWIPFYILYLFKTNDQPRRWRYPLMAALFLLFQAYAELTYASFLILFTALWAAWRTLAHLRSTTRAEFGRFVANLALVGLVFVVGLAPALVMMLSDLLVEGDIFGTGGGFADVFSADLVGFLVPTMYHPVFGSLVERFKFDHDVGQHIYLGYSLPILAVVGIVCWWRRTASAPSPPRTAGKPAPSYWVKFWTLSTFVFWLLTLGPTLRINGHDTGLPLPFALIAQLPIFKGNRYPSRYSVMLLLSLSMLVAFGLAALLQRTGKKRILVPVSLFLACLLLFEHLSVPLPLSDMRVPPVYEFVAGEMPGDFTLLDLPVAWRNGSRVTGTQHPIIMFEQYYQSVHGKRILAGNTSRNPPLKFQYFVKAPVINTLIALETGHRVDPAVVEQDRTLAPDVLRFLNIQAIVVHPTQAGPGMVPYVEGTMPVERVYEDGETVTYRVTLSPWPETWIVEPGDALGWLSYAEGWGGPAHGVIWAQRHAVRLLVPLNGAAQHVTLRAYTPAGGQHLQIEANGETVQWIGMAAGWMEYEFTLPAHVVQPGLNELWLRFETLYPAGDVTLSPRTIGETGIESPANLVVQSAGLEVGDFGHIYVDGQDVSPNQRGYNVAVIHPQTGDVGQTAAFDTHLDKNASQALATFLDSVPPGRIVAVAAADEASRLLGQEAVDALRNIGAAGDLRDRTRWGHAILGIQGATPGTALEALDWMQPVTVVAGEGATEPNLAAAFGSITFTATAGP